MLTTELIEQLFEAAHIQRWNDHIRPQGFTELDKQAHKMLIAYVLARYEEDDRGAVIDWRRLIEGGIFEYLHRIVLTDIKPPVFHELMRSHGEELNKWVLNKLAPVMASQEEGFSERFVAHFSERTQGGLEKRILRAAHYLATDWEFRIVYRLNQGLFGLEETKAKIANELEEHYHLAGVQKLGLGKKTYQFIDLAGQLRFQKRWAHSPRVPETSVMGHMLIVAMLAYFCSLSIKACDARIANNYFCGLFHDLPEVLTRDIISPVKRSVEGLDDLIKQIEHQQMEQRLLPLLPNAWRMDLLYFTEDEFANRIMNADGICEFVSEEALDAQYNEAKWHPVDGGMIRCCDHLAAMVEASLSIRHGLRSRQLEEGVRTMQTQYADFSCRGIPFGEWFAAFAKEC